MKIYITNNNKDLKTTGIKKIIKDCIAISIDKITKVTKTDSDSKYEVSVMLVDNNEIQALNTLHRNMDKPTDVLSFPMLEFDDNRTLLEDYAEFNEHGDIILGDIVISTQQAFLQANEYGHSLEREIGFLTVHSMLHLFGYDHEKNDEEQEMCTITEEILSELGLIR